MLFQFGLIQFDVYPVNVHQMDHTTGSDWARKEIAGAAIYREWVGEGDEEITLRGKLFPRFMARHEAMRAASAGNGAAQSSGGMLHLNVLDNMRRLGQAHLLIRGDGWKLGWFIIDKLSRGHTLMGPDGNRTAWY